MLWLVLSVRAVTAILYVRVRLRMVYGKLHSKAVVFGLHLIALGMLMALAVYNLIPSLAVIAMLLLVFRAFRGILRPAPQVTPKKIGFTELAYGIAYVLLVSFGYWMLLL
jgi:hypothetical protein